METANAVPLSEIARAAQATTIAGVGGRRRMDVKSVGGAADDTRRAAPDTQSAARRGALCTFENLRFAYELEPAQKVVENVRKAAAIAVESVGEPAEQVAEQLAVAGLACDRQVNLVEVDHQPEQVEV